MLCPGQVYQTSITVRDQDTVPSAATLTITKLSDGTHENHSGPWEWAQDGRDYTTSYDYTLATAGQYKFTWVTEGPGAAPPPDVITVRDYVSLVSLDEAKAHLNITRAVDDLELSRFCMAATELIEAKAGVSVRRQVTAQVASGWSALVLPQRPVLSVESVTSVWPGGPSWVTAQLLVDGPAGIVRQTSLMPFWWPPWNVAYTVGRAVPLEAHLHACKELLRHLWETQRGSMAPSLLAGEEAFTTSFGMAFTYPRRVLEAVEDQMDPAI